MLDTTLQDMGDRIKEAATGMQAQAIIMADTNGIKIQQATRGLLPGWLDLEAMDIISLISSG